jgi:hypothetical protein
LTSREYSTDIKARQAPFRKKFQSTSSYTMPHPSTSYTFQAAAPAVTIPVGCKGKIIDKTDRDTAPARVTCSVHSTKTANK